jgi:hypothetical protein
VASGGEREPGGAAVPTDEELFEQLVRAVRSADKILAGLATDMRDAGAAMASERAEKAREVLESATAAAAALQQRRRTHPPTGP